ncbi:MAG: YjcQ family protein [Candidatus Eremiobacterota bacterium]
MKLNTKQQVLVAIYMEYQKDIPDMSLINAEKLGIGQIEFNTAIDKLQNEGYINGVIFIRGGDTPIPLDVLLAETKITRDGLHYIEKKLTIEANLSGEEKVRNILEKVGSWGFTQLKEIASKTLAEVIKGM